MLGWIQRRPGPHAAHRPRVGQAWAKQCGALKRTNDLCGLSATGQDPPSPSEVVEYSKGSECGPGFKISHTWQQTSFSLRASLTGVGSNSRNSWPCVLVSSNLNASFLADLWGATSAAAGLLKETAGWVLILPLFVLFQGKTPWELSVSAPLPTPDSGWLVRNNAVCCHGQLPTQYPLTLGDLFTPVWHLAAFLHYLSLETLTGIIFLSVKTSVSTIERTFSSFLWDFLFSQVHRHRAQYGWRELSFGYLEECGMGERVKAAYTSEQGTAEREVVRRVFEVERWFSRIQEQRMHLCQQW